MKGQSRREEARWTVPTSWPQGVCLLLNVGSQRRWMIDHLKSIYPIVTQVRAGLRDTAAWDFRVQGGATRHIHTIGRRIYSI
jgi:hypothetical protein